MADAYRKVYYLDETIILETTELGLGNALFYFEPDTPTDMLVWNSNFLAASGQDSRIEIDGLNKWSGDESNEWVADTYSNMLRFWVYSWADTYNNPTAMRLHGRIEAIYLPVTDPV